MSAPFRAANFNIRTGLADDGPDAWPHRKAKTVAALKAFAPDLVGLEEPTESQWDDLTAALKPDWSPVAHDRKDTHGAESHLQGLFYRTARYDRVKDGVFWLSDTPAVPGSVTWPQDWGARICDWAVLKDRTAGKELLFAVVHTDTNGAAWLPSVKVIAGELPKLADGRPIVCVGDFNCAAGCEAHAWITKEGGFADTWTQTGQPDLAVTTFNAFKPIPKLPLHDMPMLEKWLHDTCDSVPAFAHYPAHVLKHKNYRIDWILTKGGFTTNAAAVDTRLYEGRTPSDHWPITADLEWG